MKYKDIDLTLLDKIRKMESEHTIPGKGHILFVTKLENECGCPSFDENLGYWIHTDDALYELRKEERFAEGGEKGSIESLVHGFNSWHHFWAATINALEKELNKIDTSEVRKFPAKNNEIEKMSDVVKKNYIMTILSTILYRHIFSLNILEAYESLIDDPIEWNGRERMVEEYNEVLNDYGLTIAKVNSEWRVAELK